MSDKFKVTFSGAVNVKKAEEARKEGYNAGHKAGYNAGHEEGYAAGYGASYDVGYNAGHEEGYDNGLDRLRKAIDGSITEFTAKDLAGVTAIRDYAFYYWTGEHIEIPSTVKSVGKYAFQYCSAMQSDIELPSVESVGEKAFQYSGITSLVLGANAKTHGNYAFADCPNLKTVTLENGVELGNYMFSNSALESVEFPPSVYNIPMQAFNRCSNLKRVVFPESLTNLSSYSFQYSDLSEGVVFKDGGRKLLINSEAFRATKLREIDLPNGVSRLYANTFKDCTELKRVYLPPSTGQLDGNNFNGCTALENLTVNKTTPPALLQTLGVIPTTAIIYVPIQSLNAYKAATNWSAYADQMQPISTEVVITDGVTEIPANQFANTPATSVYMPDSVTTIGERAFAGCTSLAEVRLPENLESIGTAAFARCESIESVVIPDSVTLLDGEAFRDCSSLSSVVIGSGINRLNGWLFSGTALEEVNVPDNIEVIWANAFRYCSKLKTVTIGRGVKTIIEAVFNSCPAIETFTILADEPPSLDTGWGFVPSTAVIYVPAQSLEKYKAATNWSAFGDQMKPIPHVVIADGVTEITNSQFAGMEIESVTIPDSVTTIGNSAFDGCKSLKTLNLGNGLTYIGVYAFRQCKALEEVNLPNGLTTMGGSALFGTAIRTIRIPSSLYSISGLAFSYCTYLSDVVIEEGVGSISDRAFEFCTSLKELTLPSTIGSINSASFKGSALTKLIVKALTPPTLNGQFSNVSSSLAIYVPAQSLDAYKTATNWSAYADRIHPIVE